MNSSKMHSNLYTVGFESLSTSHGKEWNRAHVQIRGEKVTFMGTGAGRNWNPGGVHSVEPTALCFSSA